MVGSFAGTPIYDEDDPKAMQAFRDMSGAALANWVYDRLASDSWSPQYRWADWIRVNPRLSKVHASRIIPYSGWEYYRILIRLPSAVEAMGCLEEYITEPPCDTVGMSAIFWQQDEWNAPDCMSSCWAHCETGLKVKDILSVRDQVMATRKRAGQTSNEVEVVASLVVLGDAYDPQSTDQWKSKAPYFSGPLPRYRKATNLLDEDGEAAYLKDRAMQWEPNMNTSGSVE